MSYEFSFEEIDMGGRSFIPSDSLAQKRGEQRPSLQRC